MSNVTSAPMRTTLIAALLCTACMLLPCAHAQQSEADRQPLADFRAKAEKGDAQSQFELGLSFYWGKFGVATNNVEAAQGETKAKRNAALLELLLSPDEIAEGKRRAQAWVEQHKKAPANNQ